MMRELYTEHRPDVPHRKMTTNRRKRETGSSVVHGVTSAATVVEF